MYELVFSPAAAKYLKKIKEKKLKTAFQKAFEALCSNPYSGEMKTGDLAGFYCYDVFYAQTNYELAYRIYEENERRIVVIMAGTRENFYEELKRYMK